MSKPKPLAYFISWTTYGTWLPGDGRGWVEHGTPGIQEPDRLRWEAARRQLIQPAVVLDQEQRAEVETTIRAHCTFRGWQLHAINPRSNHVHVVVTADAAPEEVMNQFKAWCSRRLNERWGKRDRWWTKHGSTKWINDTEYLQNAIEYVLEKQGSSAMER
jgi:REP element-mobilizing transposase RayT